ncbi:MAG TPA: tetratricopeptide repeat protein [Candidatus Kapabacteria bacterium]|nr:tetratricopeptide repeat protein [Candidatus Kapabacteria bacterium]
MVVLNILLFFVAFIAFVFINAQIIVPILYYAPRATWLFYRGEVKGSAIIAQFSAPAIWLFLFFVLGFIWPSSTDFVSSNPYIASANILATVAILWKFVTPKGRAEMEYDFAKNIERYRISPTGPGWENYRPRAETIMNRIEPEPAVNDLSEAKKLNELGMMYFDGDGVEQDYSKAFAYLIQAAEMGNSTAQHNLALMYEDGLGVEQNSANAIGWWTKAAIQGNTGSQNNLGRAYEIGSGVKQNFEEARQWYQLAAEQGFSEAQQNLGMLLSTCDSLPIDHSEAQKWFLKAAEQGEQEAQFRAGLHYHLGVGATQDHFEACRWFAESAGQGHDKAQCYLGTCYENGFGVPKDMKRAAEWYQIASDRGNVDAMLYLGLMYASGDGIERNLDTAMNLLERSVQGGCKPAIEALAFVKRRKHEDDLALDAAVHSKLNQLTQEVRREKKIGG